MTLRVSADFTAPPSNLSRPLTSLIGRDGAAAAAGAMLTRAGVRLLTLAGPGGVLFMERARAVAVSRALRDGLIRLTPTDQPDDPR